MGILTKPTVVTTSRVRKIVERVTITVEVPETDTDADTVDRVTGNARAGTLTLPADAQWVKIDDDTELNACIGTL